MAMARESLCEYPWCPSRVMHNRTVCRKHDATSRCQAHGCMRTLSGSAMAGETRCCFHGGTGKCAEAECYQSTLAGHLTCWKHTDRKTRARLDRKRCAAPHCEAEACGQGDRPDACVKHGGGTWPCRTCAHRADSSSSSSSSVKHRGAMCARCSSPMQQIEHSAREQYTAWTLRTTMPAEVKQELQTRICICGGQYPVFPDILYSLSTHDVIVEVDEFQHATHPRPAAIKSYALADRPEIGTFGMPDRRWAMDRWRELAIQRARGKRVVFIRFNPDCSDYISKTAELVQMARTAMTTVPTTRISVWFIGYSVQPALLWTPAPEPTLSSTMVTVCTQPWCESYVCNGQSQCRTHQSSARSKSLTATLCREQFCKTAVGRDRDEYCVKHGGGQRCSCGRLAISGLMFCMSCGTCDQPGCKELASKRGHYPNQCSRVHLGGWICQSGHSSCKTVVDHRGMVCAACAVTMNLPRGRKAQYVVHMLRMAKIDITRCTERHDVAIICVDASQQEGIEVMEDNARDRTPTGTDRPKLDIRNMSACERILRFEPDFSGEPTALTSALQKLHEAPRAHVPRMASIMHHLGCRTIPRIRKRLDTDENNDIERVHKQCRLGD